MKHFLSLWVTCLYKEKVCDFDLVSCPPNCREKKKFVLHRVFEYTQVIDDIRVQVEISCTFKFICENTLGPGMPGNGKGQGVHNLELHREQEERLRSAGRGPWQPHEGRWHQEDYAGPHPPPPGGFRY